MARLSVNVNKLATLRNARGGNVPDVLQMALQIERYGAQGITVHPRPDERHIRYQDVRELREQVTTEFNVEGYPDEKFMALVLEVLPDQVTLVPDAPDVLTSNAGWDALRYEGFLTEVIGQLKDRGVRTSLFMDPDEEQIRIAKHTGVDRIELYTESYAMGYPQGREAAVRPFVKAAKVAAEEGLGLNAGHDLDRHNLRYFAMHVPGLLEVSIGHALICDAITFGIENTVQLYLRELREQ